MGKIFNHSFSYALAEQEWGAGIWVTCTMNVRLEQTGVNSDGSIQFSLYLQRTGHNVNENTVFYPTYYVPNPILIRTKSSNVTVYQHSPFTINLANYAYIGSFSATPAQLNEGLTFYALNEYSYNWNYNVSGECRGDLNLGGYIAGYTLTVSKGAGVSSISVNRTTSSIGNVGVLSSGDTIYTGDTLTVSASASDGYKLNAYTSSYTVSDNITVAITAAVLSYILTIDSVQHCTIQVTRTSSPLQGASIGVLNNNATIYYNDVLTITYTPQVGYQVDSSSGSPITVTGNFTATATVSPMATIHIWNGSSWDAYLIYVYDTDGWNLYQANIYNGSTWDKYY